MSYINKLIFAVSSQIKDRILIQQQKQIIQLYKEWAKEIGERATQLSKKLPSSYGLQAQQLRALEQQLLSIAEQVNKVVEGKIKSNIYLVSDAVVKDAIKFANSLGIIPNPSAINIALTSVPNQIVQNIVTGNIYESGWSLSSRIWSMNQEIMRNAYEVVAAGVAQNMPIYDIAKLLEQYVDPLAKKPWNLKASDGKWIYKRQVDYNAQRLARTLVQHGYQQSFIATTENNPFITAYFWNANGSRVCPICIDRMETNHEGLGPGIYTKGNLPLDHPNGMCTMEPVMLSDNEIINQLADWVNSPEGTYSEIDNFASEFGYYEYLGRIALKARLANRQ